MREFAERQFSVDIFSHHLLDSLYSQIHAASLTIQGYLLHVRASSKGALNCVSPGNPLLVDCWSNAGLTEDTLPTDIASSYKRQERSD